MGKVKMTPITGSSNIAAIGRDGDKLHVQFHSGATWEYDDAAHHYDTILKHKSPGGHFHNEVKNKYSGRKVS